MTDLYDTITAQIIADLEEGITPWECPWFGKLSNPVSGTVYSGVNRLLLGGRVQRYGYSSPQFVTYRQAAKLGGHVKKGEKGHTAIFFKMVAKKSEEDGDEEGESFGGIFPVLRRFTVFNLDQTEGLDVAALADTFPALSDEDRDANAETFAANVGARIEHSGNPRAFYQPASDRVHLPHFATFKNSAGYYSTLAHELVHWTGHESRLKRDLTGRFGSDSYAIEELVAELGAAYTLANLGFTYETRHAEYIESWLTVLRGDKYAIFSASREAQNAADFLAAAGGLVEEEDDDTAAAE